MLYALVRAKAMDAGRSLTCHVMSIPLFTYYVNEGHCYYSVLLAFRTAVHCSGCIESGDVWKPTMAPLGAIAG